MQYTKPLQSLMTAMVRVELIGLDHESVSVSGSGNRPHQTKQISFRAFDCSSTLPPVDRVHGSDGHQQASIHALESANQAVHDIIRNTSDRDVLVASLDSLVDFLNQASCQQSSSCLWDQLAASISLSFHPRRIRNTIRDYLQEFSALRTRMIDSVMDSTYPVLMAEQRFAELVGQAIRFQLRMLLNEKPPRLSPQDLDYDLWSQRYSKVNDLIVMELSEGQSNGSVDDGCISALVSNALCVLYEFFGPNFLDHSTPTLTVPTVFCQLPSSNQGITREKGRSSNGLTTNLTDVVRDIEEACSFLAAAQATVFLRDLWTAPGVAREISRRGGWTETEDYATMSWKFDLWKLCPNDAHLVVLSNHTALFQRLEHLATRMMTPQRDCQSALQALETRFRLRTKQASLLSRYPEIGVAAETLQQGLAVANFPTVRSANTTI
ncbi:predicted protein [Phaeodactylum tricornutum CCAP 1055/1]|uniref:Uncharacterized protein n=1 Tax=Phaeodactylum tricornutum (strain CCAP 1055/1) TaxID=556484 RepID=B5Y5Q1_PHATC|nr:predicted protein [Phaeodactylum tricornutum CCAP 1055/1]ACI65974.1 predicted protein [Phaeodactylum tricornutum CCAP 1055/1]|eukprot:XP_002186504.1 predicted protein [Phaeodactylum tricornutum CCAP 1055/1]